MAKANTWYVGKGTEVMIISGSTLKKSVLNSFQTFGRVEIIPIPANNEDLPRNTRIVIFEIPTSKFFKMNNIEFSLSALPIRTSPPLLPTSQKISFMFS